MSEAKLRVQLDQAQREERLRAADQRKAWERVAEVEAMYDGLRERVEGLASFETYRDGLRVEVVALEDVQAALVGDE